MMFDAICWKRRLAALAIATIWLSGCAARASVAVVLGACPPVVEHIREFQAYAGQELALLPGGWAQTNAVMREQTRTRTANFRK